MKEEDVQSAFVGHLQERGWIDVVTSPRGTDVIAKRGADVIAKRGAEVLKAEVKGTTSEPGLDTDTLYGQALRMIAEVTSYAMVAPESLLPKAQGISATVRKRLDLTAYWSTTSAECEGWRGDDAATRPRLCPPVRSMRNETLRVKRSRFSADR